MPNWVSVTQVFKSDSDGEILKQAGVKSFDDPRYSKYVARLQRLRRIKEYPYTMHVVERNLLYEEVAEIFVRVNSLGVKLRGSDLALAQITARWRNSLKLLEEFQEERERQWFSFDLGLLVRAMVVFATGQSKFKSVGNIPLAKLQDGWERAKDGLRFAINFMKANAGIDDESLLSSPLYFITIAFLSQKRDEHITKAEQKQLLHWLHVANARGRYSRGSSETLLDADLATIAKGGTAADLTVTVRQQFGRLDFAAADFAGKNTQSPLFSLVFLALKDAGAKDWKTGLGISLTHQGKLHYIQYHHIFAKSLLKGTYESREINEIANMAFISGAMNRALSNKPPNEYLPSIVEKQGQEALLQQCVPTDPTLHRLEEFRKFLEARRELLAAAVNRFLEKAKG